MIWFLYILGILVLGSLVWEHWEIYRCRNCNWYHDEGTPCRRRRRASPKEG